MWVHLSVGLTGADGTLRSSVTLEQNATERLAGDTEKRNNYCSTINNFPFVDELMQLKVNVLIF